MNSYLSRPSFRLDSPGRSETWYLTGRFVFRIQKRIQRILDRLPNQSVKMRLNLFSSDFNCSGDCLFIFLRYIFSWLIFPFF